jgi:hypothetical protein
MGRKPAGAPARARRGRADGMATARRQAPAATAAAARGAPAPRAGRGRRPRQALCGGKEGVGCRPAAGGRPATLPSRCPPSPTCPPPSKKLFLYWTTPLLDACIRCVLA